MLKNIFCNLSIANAMVCANFFSIIIIFLWQKY